MIEKNQIEATVAAAAHKVRETNPMAGSITNTVTIDFVANAQLAVGGSAAMVYLPDEGEALVAAGNAKGMVSNSSMTSSTVPHNTAYIFL